MTHTARKAEGDPRSPSELAPDVDCASVQLDNALDERQAEADMCAFPKPPRLINAIEPIEDVREVRGGDAAAGVDHFDNSCGRFAERRQRDGSACGRMSQSVGDQIVHGSLKQEPIHLGNRLTLSGHGQSDASEQPPGGNRSDVEQIAGG